MAKTPRPLRKNNQPIKEEARRKFKGLDVKEYMAGQAEADPGQIIDNQMPNKQPNKPNPVLAGTKKAAKEKSVQSIVRENLTREQKTIERLERDRDFLISQNRNHSNDADIEYINKKIEKHNNNIDRLETKATSGMANIDANLPSVNPYSSAKRNMARHEAVTNRMERNDQLLQELYKQRDSYNNTDTTTTYNDIPTPNYGKVENHKPIDGLSGTPSHHSTLTTPSPNLPQDFDGPVIPQASPHHTNLKKVNKEIASLEKQQSKLAKNSNKYQQNIDKANKRIERREKLIPNPIKKANGALNQARLKIVDTVSKPINTVKQSVGRAMHKVGRVAAQTMARVIAQAATFLFTNPIGITITIIMLIIGALLSVRLIVPEPEIGVFDPPEQSEVEVEYNAWLKAFDNDDDEFYKKYRVVITSPQLVPILYEYKDDEVYDRYVTEELAKLTTAEERRNKEHYKKAAERYAEEYDTFAVRQLFLDHVEYQYSYLHREWSNWVTEIGDEGTARAYDEYDDYESTCIEIYEEDGWCDPEDEECLANPPKIQKTREYACTKYKARNVIKEYWVADRSEGDYYRETVQREIPKVNSKDIDWEWIYYDDGGVITRKQKFWKTFDMDTVYHKVVSDYNPQSEVYPGDKIIRPYDTELKSEDSRDTIEIDKKMIYKHYYSGKAGIIEENYWLEQYQEEDEEFLHFLYEAFKELQPTLDFQIASGRFLISPFLPIAQHDPEHRQISVGWFGYPGHTAIDIGSNNLKGVMENPSGEQTVHAAADGTVTYVYDGCRDNGPNSSCLKGSQSGECYLGDLNSMGYPGNLVIVEHHILDTNGQEHVFETRYVHIKKGSAKVSIGDVVTAGTPLAVLGNSGWTQGAHTHFSVSENGSFFNPEPYMMFDIDDAPTELPGVGAGSE